MEQPGENGKGKGKGKDKGFAPECLALAQNEAVCHALLTLAAKVAKVFCLPKARLCCIAQPLCFGQTTTRPQDDNPGLHFKAPHEKQLSA